ncbi:MAG: hypothetical protein M1119_06950 [Firmicutes bacterium]|nr:hypothetical protein [Bacillota bacterium]
MQHHRGRAKKPGSKPISTHCVTNFLTPKQRHNGLSTQIQEQRKLYEEAKSKHPERWAGPIRDWTLAAACGRSEAKSLDPCARINLPDRIQVSSWRISVGRVTQLLAHEVKTDGGFNTKKLNVLATTILTNNAVLVTDFGKGPDVLVRVMKDFLPETSIVLKYSNFG